MLKIKLQMAGYLIDFEYFIDKKNLFSERGKRSEAHTQACFREPKTLSGNRQPEAFA